MRRSKGSAWTARGLASVQATTSGIIDVNGEIWRCVVIHLAMAHRSLFILAKFPHVCLVRRSGISKSFQFEAFRPQVMDVDKPLPHIRLDAALEFLIGDKLR
ncbi:YcjX family protein [Escherichia coli]